jgi:hypothetical protein
MVSVLRAIQSAWKKAMEKRIEVSNGDIIYADVMVRGMFGPEVGAKLVAAIKSIDELFSPEKKEPNA